MGHGTVHKNMCDYAYLLTILHRILSTSLKQPFNRRDPSFAHCR